MRLGALFSGGKDSCLAIHLAGQDHEITCLITMVSDNPHSYMFHTPNITLTMLQAMAAEIPHVFHRTPGKKEEELADLENAVRQAVDEYDIEGIVTGAIASEYQRSRIADICDTLEIACINPLWQMDQEEVLRSVIKDDFRVMMTGVFAESLGEDWLGRIIDKEAVDELVSLGESSGINPSGEGGEIETTVLDAPFYKQRLIVRNSKIQFHRDSGVLVIVNADLEPK